jgi:transposase
MIDVTKQRLVWVQLYQDTHNSGLVCRRCGISRPRLRKWVRRHEEQGLAGLQDQRRRPRNSPNTKVGEQEESWILDLRKSRKLGARRIQNELYREQGCSLGLATIHKVLIRHNVKPLKRHRKKADYKTHTWRPCADGDLQDSARRLPIYRRR